MAKPSSGESSTLNPGAFTVGRDACNDIVVEDSSVSRCHAELRVDADGIVLVDLDSMNGTHVRENGRWIEIARATVQSREPVLLGEVVITPDSLLNRVTPDRPKDSSAASRPVRKPKRQSTRSDPRPLEMRTATGRPLIERADGLPGGPDLVTHGKLERREPSQSSRAERDQHSEIRAASVGSPAIRRRRRRILVAAIAALVMVSVGIGAIGWVLMQPSQGADARVLSKTQDG